MQWLDDLRLNVSLRIMRVILGKIIRGFCILLLWLHLFVALYDDNKIWQDTHLYWPGNIYISKSMPPLGIFVAYWIHLSLSSNCIVDWAFSEKEQLLYCNYIFIIYFLACLYPKTQKHLNYYFLLNLLTNTFSSSWVRQPFLYWKVLQLFTSTWESSASHFCIA
jgi:hypothetical protein